MAIIVEQGVKFFDSVLQSLDDKISGPTSRFLDRSPVFVTYYHINPDESTQDGGFKDIEDYLSDRSPLKFQRITNFPLYDVNPIVLQLNDNEQGLDSEFQDEVVILPHTLRPLQNDFFIIPSLKEKYIFRVVDVQYDNIRPDGFYKITYRFEYYTDEKYEHLENQVHDKFSCILGNIGTENACLIEEESKELIDKIDAMYSDMADTFYKVFYSERYNCFLAQLPNGHKLFDPLMSVFFNSHNLLNKKEKLTTLILSEEFVDNRRKLKYERSIYRLFERRDKKYLNEITYTTFPGMNKQDSSFYRWHDQSINVVDICYRGGKGDHVILPDEVVNIFKLNAPTESKYVELMQKFIRKEKIDIKDIPLTLNEELMYLDANEEVFFFTPILLYIIKTLVNEFLV